MFRKMLDIVVKVGEDPKDLMDMLLGGRMTIVGDSAYNAKVDLYITIHDLGQGQ